MKIFISHSSADRDAADAFVDLLRDALVGLRADDIRCTSVQGYGLSAGTVFEEQLRREIAEAECLVALLTPAGQRSTYVLFELGARWQTGRPFLAVQMCGLRPESLKGPISNVINTDGSNEWDVEDMLATVAKLVGVGMEKQPAFRKALRRFVMLSSVTQYAPPPAEPEGGAGARANVASIISPQEMEEVPQRVHVTGRTGSLAADLSPWLIVETAGGLIYPQASLPRVPGDWMRDVRIGRNIPDLDKGGKYDVLLVAVGADTNYNFEKYVRGESEHTDSMGRVRPSEMLVLDSRRVVRRD